VLAPDEIDRVAQDGSCQRRPPIAISFGPGQGGGRAWIARVCRHQQSKTAQTSATERLAPDPRREKFLD
jgi:hypothetical protein